MLHCLVVIPLTKNLHAIIDDEDIPMLQGKKWHVHGPHNGLFYAWHNKLGAMHRLIIGAKEGEHVDHKNGNSLDNRRSNLRICTRSQNIANAKLRADSTTKAKGVNFRTFGKYSSYRVRIGVSGKRVNVGHFQTIKEAKNAYATAAKFYFGEFARPV